MSSNPALTASANQAHCNQPPGLVFFWMQRTESNFVFSEGCGIQKDVDTERADAVR